MIKQHLRQAWTMMKQHKFFTGVYLIGTAVSITLAMTLFIIFYIKLGNIYPEENRDRMVVISDIYHEKEENGGHFSGNTSASLNMIEQIKGDAKHIDNLAYCLNRSFHKHTEVNVDGKYFGKYETPAFINSGFWKVFNYRFLSGRAFTEKEEHENVVVLSRSYAMKLFADTAIVGRTISLKNTPYRIMGVIEDAPLFMAVTNGDLFLPIGCSIVEKYKEGYMDGVHTIYMTAPTAAERDTLKKEIEDIVNRMAQNLPETEKCEVSVWEHWRLGLMYREDGNFFDAISRYLYILLAFLFIPALNLSGAISSRMNSRMTEVGVRKAYGATDKQIIMQVLWENLLLTFIGAIMGLIMSYVVVYTCSSWIITFFDPYIYTEPTAKDINTDMLMNPTVLLSTLLLTLVLNVASALLPTMIALKKDIVQSLYQRR